MNQMVTESANDKLHLDLHGDDKDTTKKDREGVVVNGIIKAEYWKSF